MWKMAFFDASEGTKADIIYLCSPNNPTGGVYNREQLKEWVDYANEQDAILLFDAAYESFVADPALPRSIFEIEAQRPARSSSAPFEAGKLYRNPLWLLWFRLN